MSCAPATARIFLSAAVVFVSLSTRGASAPRTQNANVYPDAIKVVVLEGSAHERGLTHGRALKNEIHAVVQAWKASLVDSNKIDAETFIARFLAHTDFLPSIKRWTPDLLDEVRGLAEGADIDFNTMLAFQLPDEQWVYALTMTSERCSGMGFDKSDRSPALTAQNMDVPPFYNGFQTILHVKGQDGLDAFVLTSAGFIGMNGMNSRSVSVCTNTLAQLAPARDGLPVAFIVRGILAQHTQADAIRFLKTVKHASGQNYIVGGPEHPRDFECSAGKVVEFVPFEGATVVYHTNHALASDDFSDDYRGWMKATEAIAQEAGFSGTRTRYQALETRLRGVSAAHDVELAKATLRSHDSSMFPICRHFGGAGGFTYASTIMVLSAQPYLIVAPGPPDLTTYQTLTFSPRTK
jgi:hypothetical protein